MAMNYIRGPSPIWFFNDLTGLVLTDQFYMSFLQNIFPYLPNSQVFEDNQGVFPWSNPIFFLPNGGLPDNIYLSDTQTYRLEVRQMLGQAPSQSDPLIYAINNYQPTDEGSGGGGGGVSSGSLENQISNPQFAFVNFPTTITSPSSTTPTLSIAAAGTYNIAPGWQLVLTGSGTATLTQLVFTGTVSNQAPPYALRIATSGWTTAILQQIFNGVGAIWYPNFISASLYARSEDGLAHTISVNYVPNSPGSPVPIINSVALVTTTAFGLVQGSVALTTSGNSALNTAATVSIQIALPTVGTIDISDVQVMGQETLLTVPFKTLPDETLERQTDHLFHYYANQLLIKPKNSLLTGWNFALNPWQFNVLGATPITATSACAYIADQTILYQNATSSVNFFQNVGNSFPSPYNDLVIQAHTSATDTRFALIQYIDPSSIGPYWGSRMSTLIRAVLQLGSGNSTQVRLKVRLIYRANLPSTLSSTEPIASWSANSDPVFSAGWTAIAPQIDQAPILPTASLSGGELPAISYNNFQLPTQAASAQVLGIVVYTMDQMSSVSGHLDSIIFDKISLVPNQFAIDTHTETFDESLRKCQFYYEKSYLAGIVPGTSPAITPNGMRALDCVLGFDATFANWALYQRYLFIQYMQVKRANPTVTFYSPSAGTAARVDLCLFQNQTNKDSGPLAVNISGFTVQSSSPHSIYYLSNNNVSGTALLADSYNSSHLDYYGQTQFHYTANSNMGQ